MRQITDITSDAKQKYDIILDDNSVVELTLEYIDSKQGWIFSVTRNDFTVNQRNLVVSPNVLRQFRNYIPFGLAVFSTDKLEPAFIDDFTNDRISLYILNESDLDYLEDNIYVR